MSKNNLTLSKTEAASVCKQLSFACHWLSSPCLGLGQITARSLKCPKPVEPCHLERLESGFLFPAGFEKERTDPALPSESTAMAPRQPEPSCFACSLTQGTVSGKRLRQTTVSGKRRAPSRSVTAHSRRPRGSLSSKARGARRAVDCVQAFTAPIHGRRWPGSSGPGLGDSTCGLAVQMIGEERHEFAAHCSGLRWPFRVFPSLRTGRSRDARLPA